jgi:hypothetical protein
MTNISPTCPHQGSNRALISSHLHSEGRTQESKAESSDSSPSERQKTRLVPGIEVIATPVVSTKKQVLFGNDSDVDNCPIADNAQERLKRIVVVFGSKAANYQSDDEAESDEEYSRNSDCPGSQVLSMQCEGIVVWNIVLFMSIFILLRI